MTSASSRVPRAAAWTGIGLLATGVIRFAGRWLSDSLFGIEGLALVTAALSISTIAAIPGAIGMSSGITKLIAEKTVSGQGEQTAVTAVRWGLTAAVVAAAAGALYSMGDPAVESFGPGGAALIAILTVAFAAYTLGKSILFGFGRIRSYTLSEATGLLLFTLGALAAWWIGRVEVLLVALAMGYLPVARSVVVRKVDSSETVERRTLLGYTAVGTVGSLAGVGFTATTPLVASALGGVAGVALIGAILAILEPLNLAPRAVGLAILPDISRSESGGNTVESADTLRTATGLVAAVALPICLLLLLERDRILGWVFPSDLVGGATLGWFAMAFMVSVIGAPSVTALAAANLKLASVSMTASLIGFGTAAVLWITLGDSQGVTAIAIGYFVGSVIQVGIPIVTAWRRFGVRWASQWGRIAAATAVAAVLARQGPSLGYDAGAVAVAAIAMAPELRGLFAGLRREA